MSDDLVKRLYDRRVCSPAQNSCRNDLVLDQAAERIEELEADRKKTYEAMLKVTRIHDEAEAKLAKAVEALEFYSTLIGEKHECPWHMLSEDFGEKARTTLAALKGQDDE